MVALFEFGSEVEDGAVCSGGPELGASDNGDFPAKSLHRHDLLCDFIFGNVLGRATDREPGNTKEVGVVGTPPEVDDFLPDELDEADDGRREDAGRWKPCLVGEDETDDPFLLPEYLNLGLEPLSVEIEIFEYWTGGSGTRTREGAA